MERKIPIVRHLEDIDDLSFFGRDGSLVPGQEKKAELIAAEILSEVKSQGSSSVFFISSPRNRAFETAELIRDPLTLKQPDLKVKIACSEDMRENDQGKPVLPSNYKPGDNFEGFKIAGKIFIEEVFGADLGGKDNLLYRYGDPVLQQDGTYKYPELRKFFETPGESYRDVLVRVYSGLISFTERLNTLSSKTKIVVITHSQIIQIFKDLVEVANLINDGKLIVNSGELPRKCWETYKKRGKKLSSGSTEMLSIESIYNPHMIDLLKRELVILQNL